MADLTHSSPQRVRFGAFEVDLRAGELWKSGRKRKLTGQPFAVLAILLERPGEVVGREELQKRLWPDTFVDVDHNLNAAINKIREALGDSPERPRFIETLSRRGYRFIAPVENVEPTPLSLPEFQPSLSTEPASASDDWNTPAPVPASAQMRKNWRVWLWAAIAALVLVLGYFLRPALPPPVVTGATQLTHDSEAKLKGGPGSSPPQLATDGSRICFTEALGEKLMQVSTEGGDVIPIEVPVPFHGLADISSVRPEILFNGPPYPDPGLDSGIWELPLPGGQPRQVGDLRVYDATFTPDGNTIIYDDQRAIFKANRDGSQPRKILSIADGYPFWSRVSPDGALLRFSIFNPKLHTTSLWEANTDGSHLRQLFAGLVDPTNECCGTWTTDGKYFVFQTLHKGITSLWATREKGEWWQKVNRTPVNLTAGQMDAESPLPSRDATKIFFVGSERKDEIIRYEPSTRSFMPYLTGLSAESLAFTADGKKIAYVSYPEGDLWKINTDGTERRQLTFPPMEVSLPRWSPDGSRIAYTAHEAGKPLQIFIAAAQGTEQLTSGDSDHEDASWSPDGNSMAFGGSTYDAAITAANNIHILDLKTRKVRDVPGSAGVFSPRWSPDGRYLLATTSDFQKLMIYDFTTEKWQVLADVEADYPSARADWSRDGKCVYFNNAQAKTLSVYRICLDKRKPERIVDLSQAGTLAYGRFGWWTGLGPDDSILAARDIGSQEIYALDVKFPR